MIYYCVKVQQDVNKLNYVFNKLGEQKQIFLSQKSICFGLLMKLNIAIFLFFIEYYYKKLCNASFYFMELYIEIH